MGLAAVALFGLTLPVTKILTPHMHPLFIGLGRALLASIVALLILLVTKQPYPNIQQFKKLAVIALGVVIGFPVLSAWAMQTVPASHGGVVMGIAPLATVVAGVTFSRERPSLGFWVAALSGALLVVTFSLLDGTSGVVIGDIILLMAILLMAVGYAVGGTLAKQMGGWQVICWALVISAPVIMLPAWHYAPADLTTLPASIIAAFLYLALISQLFGFFLWYKGLAMGGVARVSQTQLLQPFVTISASAIIVGEAISLTMLLFAGAVIATVALGKSMPIHHR